MKNIHEDSFTIYICKSNNIMGCLIAGLGWLTPPSLMMAYSHRSQFVSNCHCFICQWYIMYMKMSRHNNTETCFAHHNLKWSDLWRLQQVFAETPVYIQCVTILYRPINVIDCHCFIVYTMLLENSLMVTQWGWWWWWCWLMWTITTRHQMMDCIAPIEELAISRVQCIHCIECTSLFVIIHWI